MHIPSYDLQNAVANQQLTDALAAAAPQPQPTVSGAHDISATLSRAQRRAIQRGKPGKVVGNNKPNRKGGATKQEDVAFPMLVGDEPRLIEIVRMVRGKGGKKKYIRAKELISREILIKDKKLRQLVMGMTFRSQEAEENDSIKIGNVGIGVMVPRNGRVVNTRK